MDGCYPGNVGAEALVERRLRVVATVDEQHVSVVLSATGFPSLEPTQVAKILADLDVRLRDISRALRGNAYEEKHDIGTHSPGVLTVTFRGGCILREPVDHDTVAAVIASVSRGWSEAIDLTVR